MTSLQLETMRLISFQTIHVSVGLKCVAKNNNKKVVKINVNNPLNIYKIHRLFFFKCLNRR